MDLHKTFLKFYCPNRKSRSINEIGGNIPTISGGLYVYPYNNVPYNARKTSTKIRVYEQFGIK